MVICWEDVPLKSNRWFKGREGGGGGGGDESKGEGMIDGLKKKVQEGVKRKGMSRQD